MDRKEFLSTGAILGTMTLAPGCTQGNQKKKITDKEDILMDIPNFCSHEHWGSIFSIGQFPGGFNADLRPGALPERRTTLMDILMDPYFAGSLMGNGFNPFEQMVGLTKYNLLDWSVEEPVEAYKTVMEPLKNFRLKGTYQSLRLGINLAYGYDIHTFDRDRYQQTDNQVGENYKDIFTWYRKMMEKANLSDLIRPVHPEFYTGDFNSGPAREESSFTTTLMRIDPFLNFWTVTNSRRDQLADQLGIDPADGSSWRDFLEKMFTVATKHGCIGIKQLQAYFRSLDFEPVNEREVRFRGELSDQEVKRFQDWVMHTCCELTNQRKWPHQIHVGTHNHPRSNPLPLENIAKMYPDQKIVMLHCWPYIEEAGYLAQGYPNVYIDTCWQPILNPDFLRQSMDTWLGYIPLNKITMSNDSTSVEMASGASMITRKVLAEKLSSQKNKAELFDHEVREIATQLLHNNAVDIYEIGNHYHS